LTTLAKAKAKTNETFIVQASLTIVTYDHQNMFIVQATGHGVLVEVDDNNMLIVGHPLGIYEPPAQASPNTLINYYNNYYI
jgi:hypothetical protein